VPRGSQLGLEVVRADRVPYRALWQTRGLDADGWLSPRRPATLRVYAQRDRAETVELTAVVRRPRHAFARYTVRSGAVERTATITVESAVTERIRLCVAPGRPADVTFTGRSTVFRRRAFPGRGSRPVTARLGRVSLHSVATGCSGD
jgi:hypothetical protein